MLEKRGAGADAVGAKELSHLRPRRAHAEVRDHRLRRVHHLQPGAQHAKEQIRLTAGAQRRARAEHRIEAAHLRHHLAAQGEVGGDAPVLAERRVPAAPLAHARLEMLGEAARGEILGTCTRPQTTAASGSEAKMAASCSTQSGAARQSSSVKAMTEPVLRSMPVLRPLVTPRRGLGRSRSRGSARPSRARALSSPSL